MAQLLKEDPKKVVELLKYASTFPDFKGFNAPGLSDPNYVPPDRSGPLLIYAYFMAGFTTVVVILRLWIRIWVKGMAFGWDDYLIIPGQVFALGMIVVMILLLKIGGVGLHVYDLTLEQIYKTQTLEFVGIQVYMTAIFFIRISITALLYRLIGRSSKTKRLLLHITVAILAAEWIVQILTFTFATKPISAAWDMDVRLSGFNKTINLPLEVFILTIFYLVMDVWLLVLPIHTIWNLQLPLRTRISVSWVFIFGAVACGGAILKTVYIYPVLDSYDATWHGTGFIAGALTEIGFGVISSSMPALNHMVVKVLPRTLGSWFSSGSGNTKSSKEFPRSRQYGSDGIDTADGDKNVFKTTMLEVSSFSDELPSYHSRDAGSPINFSRKTSMRETRVDEWHNKVIYSPAWLGAQLGKSGRDLESNSQELSTSTEASTMTLPPHQSKEEIQSKSWLNVR